MSEKQNIPERLRVLRARRKWTQQQLAEALGYDRNYVSMVEGGREPGPKFLRVLTLLESSPIGREITSEQSAHSLPAPHVQEAAANYDLIKKVIHLNEVGTDEQKQMIDDLLDTFLKRIPPAAPGDKLGQS